MRKLKDYLAYCKKAVAEQRLVVQSDPNLGVEIKPGQAGVRYWNNGALVVMKANGEQENFHYYIAQQLFPHRDRYNSAQQLAISLGNQNFQTMQQAVNNQRRVPLRSRWFRRLVLSTLGMPAFVPTPSPEYNK